MRVSLFAVVLLALTLWTCPPPAAADTFYLNTGVTVKGKVELEKDGLIHLLIGGRPVVIQAAEVVNTEKNDDDGSYNEAEAKARYEAEEQKMTELTGLNTEQRRQIDGLIEQLNAGEERKQSEARKQLVKLGETMDVYRYLAFLAPSSLPTFMPRLLMVMFDLKPNAMRDVLVELVGNPSEEVRATCLQLLGELGDKSSAELFARGLLDHELPVRLAAGNALAAIQCREATPLLIRTLDTNDLRLQSVSLKALSAAWSTPEKPVSYLNAADWTTFWEGQAAAGVTPFDTEKLTPLVEAGTYFQNE